MERQPVATETFTQNVQHAPAAPGVLEGHHKVVGKPHELARPSQPGLCFPLEPRIQHMVQEDVREHRADNPALGRAGLGSAQDTLFENPRLQPFVDHASDDAILDPQVEEYVEQGIDAYEKRRLNRKFAHLDRQAQKLGFQLILKTQGEEKQNPMPSIA